MADEYKIPGFTNEERDTMLKDLDEWAEATAHTEDTMAKALAIKYGLPYTDGLDLVAYWQHANR